MRRAASHVSFACLVSIASLGVQLGFSGVARADVAACVNASESALTLRRDGKLRDALKQLVICADPACPREVTEECGRRARVIDDAMPTLILSATDENGADLLTVKVTIDGALVAQRIDGRALALDPGAHVVRLEGGGIALAKTLVLRESEKDRRENFVLGHPKIAPPPLAPQPEPAPAFGTQKKLAVVSGGLGIVGVALGVTFGALANGKKSNEQRDCSAAGCDNYGRALSEYGSARDFATISTISWIAAAAFLATGVVLYFTSPNGGTASARATTSPGFAF